MFRDSVLERQYAIARNIFSPALYQSPNSAYEKRIKGDNVRKCSYANFECPKIEDCL